MAVLEIVFSILSTNVLSIVLAISVGIIIYAWGIAPYRRSNLIAITGDLPGPTSLPFIGNLLDVIKHKGQMHLQFAEYSKKYGRVYALLIFGKTPCIVANDPEMVKDIMVKEFSSFHDRPILFPLPEPFDSMLTVASGDTWQRIRNTLSPTFSTHKMRLMIPLMNSSCDVLMKKLEQVAETGKTFNIHKFYQGLTMDTILKTAFGIQSDAQNNYDDPAFKAARRSLDVGIVQRIAQSVVSILPCSSLLVKYMPSIFIGQFDDLLQLTEKIIEVKRKSGDKHGKDMLDLMLSAADNENEAKRLSEAEVIAQSVVFLIAGYETTNNTLSFVSHSLATNPDVQEKLQQEIDSVWSDEDEIPSKEAVRELPYLDMVMSETLRLYPPGFIHSRECTKDCVIKGVHFRKGVCVLMDVYTMHRDPEFWPEPEKFDPERFSVESKQARDPYTYLPFGHGPHNCIGMRFAQMEMKLALVRILKKYSFVVTPETKVPPKIELKAVLGCGDEMNLAIKARM